MSYGVATDWFGLANSTTTLLQSSEKSSSYATDASVSDSNGDIRCRTKAGQVDEYSVTYKLCGGGTFVMDTAVNLKIGETVALVGDTAASSIQVTGIEVGTSNSDHPVLTYTGIKEATGKAHNTYSTGQSVTASKTAQIFGIVALTSNNYVTSGSFEISGSLVTVEDSQGDIVCREPYGYRMTASNTVQNCTADPTGVEDTANGWFYDSPVGLSSSNTDYGTTSVEVFKDLEKDA